MGDTQHTNQKGRDVRTPVGYAQALIDEFARVRTSRTLSFNVPVYHNHDIYRDAVCHPRSLRGNKLKLLWFQLKTVGTRAGHTTPSLNELMVCLNICVQQVLIFRYRYNIYMRFSGLSAGQVKPHGLGRVC